jgi:hypothetical protein
MFVNETWAKRVFYEEILLDVTVNFAIMHVWLTRNDCNATDGKYKAVRLTRTSA